MRLIFTILFFWTNFVHATNYYVSNAGNNSNNGTSTATPWQTVAKVVASLGSINANDSVLFRCGDTFAVSASVVITKPGIKFGSYGTGLKPVLTCLTTVTGWTLVSTGLYKASLSAPNDLRYVTIDGSPVEWARTPNKNNGLSSYYYSTSYSNGTPKTITLSGLPTTPSRTGHRFALKGQTWAMGIAKCSNHSGSTLTYSPGAENLLGFSPTFRYPSRSATGICFVGNIADCDQYGEWAYDSTAQELYMFFDNVNPNSKTVKASVVDKLFDLGSNTNMSFEGLELMGANRATFIGKNGSSSLSFKRLKFSGSGGKGIYLSNCPSVTVEDDSAINCYGITFRLPTNATSTASVKRNYIYNTGPFETMHYLGDDQDGSALVCGMSNAVISHNKIINSHYHGIWVTASNVVCDTNYISRYGVWNNDCGGIYTFGLAGYGAITTYTNRVARNNIIDSGIAFVYGYGSVQSAEVKGIYNDARAHNFLYQNNVINNCDIGASNNNPNGITLRGNTLISRRGINFRRYKFADLTDFNIKANLIGLINNSGIIYAYYTDSIGSQTIAQDFAGDVSIDSNICNSVNTAYNAQTNTMASTNYYIAGWRTLTGVSANDVIVPYYPLAETGRKLVVNWTAAAAPVSLSYKYKDYYGTNYHSGSITLPAYGFKLLLYDGTLDGTPPPPPVSPGDPVTVPWRIVN